MKKRISKFANKYMGQILISPTLLFLFGIIGVPILIGLTMSFFRYRLTILHLGTPFIGLDNFNASIRNPYFFNAVKNTLWWTVINVVGQVGVGLGVALLLNQKIKGIFIYKAAILIPWAIPAAVAALNWRWLLHADFGLVNYVAVALGIIESPIPWLGIPRWARFWVIVARIWKEFPLSTLIALAGLQAIPKSLYEAAAIDGAGVLQRFKYITLPYLRAPLTVVSTLIAIWTFNSFNMIWVMTGGGPVRSTEILATHIYKVAFEQFNFGLAASQAILMVILLSVLILFYLLKLEGEKID